MIYLVRGLPGSGKSTLAKTLADSLNIPLFEADQYFYNSDGVYNFDGSKLGAAHSQCFANFVKNVKGCIVSNTFTTDSELAPYIDYCKSVGELFTVLVVENRHGNQSIHNVPEKSIENMRNRFSIKL
jgi:broad-specificity NMP kinase